jgi:hypothetical protein
MLVNPARYPSVKQDLGYKFIDWLISATGQKTIADYKINGKQLFFPDGQACHGLSTRQAPSREVKTMKPRTPVLLFAG